MKLHLTEWAEHDPTRTASAVYLYVSDADALHAEWVAADAEGRLGEPRDTASAPIRAIDKMTVISTDGASSLSRSVASHVAQGPRLGSDLTEVDLAGLLARFGAARAENNTASTSPISSAG